MPRRLTEQSLLSAPRGAQAAARFGIADWVAYTLGPVAKGGRPVSTRGTATGESENQAALPPLLRRRVTSIGQLAFRAASGVSAPAPGRLVFCSRHGEFQRTVGLLAALAAREPPSPAEFSLSVHNALAGLLSIARQSREGHTAISAGPDSFAFGLIEAAASLAERPEEGVLLVYFDEPLPDSYEPFRDAEETAVALALLMVPPNSGGDEIAVSCEPPVTSVQHRSASGQAADFLTFLQSGLQETASPGMQRQWRWRRVA